MTVAVTSLPISNTKRKFPSDHVDSTLHGSELRRGRTRWRAEILPGGQIESGPLGGDLDEDDT